MSVLVWVMGDGEHQDMIATCRADTGILLTMRWDWREDGGMIGFRHDLPAHADATLEGWTRELELNGSVLIAGPIELFITGPDNSGDYEVMRWWEHDLRPIVVDMVPDPSWDEECTLDLPTGTHAAWEALTIKCGPAPYRAKLSWGP